MTDSVDSTRVDSCAARIRRIIFSRAQRNGTAMDSIQELLVRAEFEVPGRPAAPAPQEPRHAPLALAPADPTDHEANAPTKKSNAAMATETTTPIVAPAMA